MTTPNRTDIVLLSIELERQRQDKLIENGRIPFDLTDVTIDDPTKLSVLMEEVGEIARSLNEEIGLDNSLDHLYVELVQVAAVATAWAESIHELREYVNTATADLRLVASRTPVPVREGVRGTGL